MTTLTYKVKTGDIFTHQNLWCGHLLSLMFSAFLACLETRDRQGISLTGLTIIAFFFSWDSPSFCWSPQNVWKRRLFEWFTRFYRGLLKFQYNGCISICLLWQNDCVNVNFWGIPHFGNIGSGQIWSQYLENRKKINMTSEEQWKPMLNYERTVNINRLKICDCHRFTPDISIARTEVFYLEKLWKQKYHRCQQRMY